MLTYKSGGSRMTSIKPLFFVGLLIVLGVLMTSTITLSNIARDQKSTIQALKDTGPFGDQFEITLPDGKVAVAGTIVSADEAREFSINREGDLGSGDDVIYQISPGIVPVVKVVIFKRPHFDKK